MAYDEEEARRSRVVVETPNERREVVHSQSVRTPDNSGMSAGMVGVLVVVAIALITMLVLFWLSSQPQTTDNANLAATQQQPTTIVQQPAPATQPPVIINGQPATSSGATSGATTSGPDDSSIQTAVDKKLNDDPSLSALAITATVMNGKVTLIGMVHREADKSAVERAVRQVKGVKSIDNQISVSD